MLIIVGLGNPGLKYKKTYHNMGFVSVDKLADILGVSFKKSACEAKIAELFVGGEKIVIAKPMTYMNNSGQCVKQLVGSYKAKPNEVLVIYDDIDLDCGVLRLRDKGSGGTHNGMRSVVSAVGENVPRIRVGIGKSEEMPLIDYVLSSVKGDKKEILSAATERAARAAEAYIRNRDLASVGALFNGKG